MAVNGFKEYMLRMVFSAFIVSGVSIFSLSLVDAHAISLSKLFKPSDKKSNNSSSSSNNNSNSRKLNLWEIITHFYWYHRIAETGHSFIWTIIPEEYQHSLKAYEEFKGPKKTPYFIKHLLNHPSETAADFAETFTRHVLSNLGFHHLSSSSSSSSDHNHSYEYPGGNDSPVSCFERVLSKSCFASELVKRYNSIDWDNVGVPPSPIQFTDIEKRVLRGFYFKPEDNKWIEPLNNWFNWYIKTIHERIFPSQDFQVFEATVKFLFFSFMHDTAAPFISLFVMLGVSV